MKLFGEGFFTKAHNLVPRVSHLGGKMRDPGNEVEKPKAYEPQDIF